MHIQCGSDPPRMRTAPTEPSCALFPRRPDGRVVLPDPEILGAKRRPGKGQEGACRPPPIDLGWIGQGRGFCGAAAYAYPYEGTSRKTLLSPSSQLMTHPLKRKRLFEDADRVSCDPPLLTHVHRNPSPKHLPPLHADTYAYPPSVTSNPPYSPRPPARPPEEFNYGLDRTYYSRRTPSPSPDATPPPPALTPDEKPVKARRQTMPQSYACYTTPTPPTPPPQHQQLQQQRKRPRAATASASASAGDGVTPTPAPPATLRLTFKLLKETLLEPAPPGPAKSNSSRTTPSEGDISPATSSSSGTGTRPRSRRLTHEQGQGQEESVLTSQFEGSDSNPYSFVNGQFTYRSSEPQPPSSTPNPSNGATDQNQSQGQVYRHVTVLREVPPLQRSRKQVYQTLAQFEESGGTGGGGGTGGSTGGGGSGAGGGGAGRTPFRIYVHQQGKGKRGDG